MPHLAIEIAATQTKPASAGFNILIELVHAGGETSWGCRFPSPQTSEPGGTLPV